MKCFSRFPKLHNASVAAAIVILLVSTSAGAQTLVKDILPGSSHAAPDVLLNMNGTLYFNAADETHGRELWKSDGTAAGTVMIKDILPGASNAIAHGSQNKPAAVNGTLYFAANDSMHGLEVWKTDGTEAGTTLLKDINPGTGGSLPFNFVNVNGTLYFTASDGNGNELWKSDGTAAGTVMVKDIFPGSGSSGPTLLTNMNGVLFFRATNGSAGRELWKSDGTAAGTGMVKDIRSGSSDGLSPASQLFPLNGMIYFRATNGSSGNELWKSDGTTDGTVQVSDINPGSGNSIPNSTNAQFAAIDTILYFIADNGSNGPELWKSDGTTQGTVMVKDIYSGFPGSASFPNSYLTNVNGILYFRASTPEAGDELWKSDGTENGTVLVKDIFPGNGNSSPTSITASGGSIFFSARSGINTNGIELWKSNGTEAGTVEMDIRPGVNESSAPGYFTDVNGTLFFIADDGTAGQELWKYSSVTAIKGNGNSAPFKYVVSQNFPNPFNPSTTIEFHIPQNGVVTLSVYDVVGREVSTLVNEYLNAGTYRKTFDGTGRTSGVYYYKITAGPYAVVRKMVLLK